MIFDDSGLLTKLISAAHKIYIYNSNNQNHISIPEKCQFCKDTIVLGRCDCGVQDIITILTPLLPKELRKDQQ